MFHDVNYKGSFYQFILFIKVIYMENTQKHIKENNNQRNMFDLIIQH
jgi:hypothetical protein